jgi:hypothetical protein
VEKRTRYNELLGIPNAIRDPDLYQLLGLDRGAFDPAQVEERYRERMGTLQAIKSPKHKSFIEFLKGELRRARAVLVDARQRAEYDRELLEERREQLTRILDVVLADGALRPAEEQRIQALAAEVGLFPDEAEAIVDEELRARGARRAPQSDVGAVAPAPPPRAPSSPSARNASSSDIQRAIARSITPPTPARPPQRPPAQPRPANPPMPVRPPRPIQIEEEEEEVVAELVEEAPPPAPAPRFQPETRGQSGWGQAAVTRVVGVCSSCLCEVNSQDLATGRGEKLDDGRLHCPACFNRLVAGLICCACYQRITRSEMKGGKVRMLQGRAGHTYCIGG